MDLFVLAVYEYELIMNKTHSSKKKVGHHVGRYGDNTGAAGAGVSPDTRTETGQGQRSPASSHHLGVAPPPPHRCLSDGAQRRPAIEPLMINSQILPCPQKRVERTKHGQKKEQVKRERLMEKTTTTRLFRVRQRSSFTSRPSYRAHRGIPSVTGDKLRNVRTVMEAATWG